MREDDLSLSDSYKFARTIKRGTRQQALEAIRDLLSQRLFDAQTKDSAAVAKQLIAVINELDSMGIGREESFVDGLRSERKANTESR